VELLCTQGVVAGVIGPREIARVWERHVRNSVAVAPFVPPASTVIDLGSGAGLPGIPTALVRPDVHMILLDSMARRVRFLELAADVTGLTCTIEHARAETARVRAATIICRAVAPASRLLPWGHRLCDGAGTLIALKGRAVADEVAEVDAALRRRPTPAWAPEHYEVKPVTWPDDAVLFVATWRRAHAAGGSAPRREHRREKRGVR
jgi:16S rRNA (guanine527-N7)-methyltransferase